MARLRMDGVSSDALVPTPPAGKATIFYNSTDRLYKAKLDDGSVVTMSADAEGPVTSVNGQTGVVTLNKSDIGLGNVDNTSDANKPISNATQLALNVQELRISTAEGEIDTLQIDVGALQTSVGTLQTDVSALQSSLSDLGNRVFTVEGEVVGLDGAVSGLDTRVTTLEGSVGTLQTDVGTLQTDVSSVQGEIATIEGQLTNVDNAISALQSDVTGKLNTSGGMLAGDLDMDYNFINNLPGPVDPNQPATKNYVDTEIAAIPAPVMTDYVRKDGTTAMTGDLNMEQSGGGSTYNVATLDGSAVPIMDRYMFNFSSSPIDAPFDVYDAAEVQLGTVSYDSMMFLFTWTAAPGSPVLSANINGIQPSGAIMTGTGLTAFNIDIPKSYAVVGMQIPESGGGSTYHSVIGLANAVNPRDAVNKQQLDSAIAGITVPVTSVAGKTGAVTLTSSDVGLGNVDNTSDANKPISSATATALNAKLALAGGTMSGSIAMGGFAITGLLDPSLAQDAATKAYADNVSSAVSVSTQATAYVSKNGNDLTGVISNPAKPFVTIGAAISALNVAGYNTPYNPSMIMIAPGIYVENLTLKPCIGLTTLSGTLDYTVTIQGAHTFSPTSGIISANQINLIGLLLQNPTNSASTIAFTGTAPGRMRVIDCSVDMGNNTGSNPTIYINNSGSGSHISLWGRITQCGVSKSSPTGDAVQIVSGGLNSYGYDISSTGGNAINMSGGSFNVGYGTVATAGQQAIVASAGNGSLSVVQVYNPTSNKDGILQSGTSVITCGITSFNIAGTTGYCARGAGTFIYTGLTFTGASGNARIQNTLTRIAIPATPSFVV